MKRGPLQHPGELDAFTQIVRQHGVTSYLEIGAKFGGSLNAVVRAMPIGARAVSVDIGATPELNASIGDLRLKLYDVHFVLGDSTDPKVVDAVRALGPYDLCLIDGNHTEPYVQSDWRNYGPMAKIVAFHDISWDMNRNPGKSFKIEVPKVWKEISVGRKVREIRLCPTRDNGFGILWND